VGRAHARKAPTRVGAQTRNAKGVKVGPGENEEQEIQQMRGGY